MKKFLLFLTFLMFGLAANSQTRMINNQSDWNTLVPGSNAVFNGEVIIIMGNISVTNGLSLNMGGILTIMPGVTVTVPAGLFIDATSTLNNYGTLSISGGADWLGAVVNTGSITMNGGIVGGQNTLSCGTITHAPGSFTPRGPAPVGTRCNDGNSMTQNDQISNANCVCAGTPIAPIPTLGEWGMIILALITMIFGVVAMSTQTRRVVS